MDVKLSWEVQLNLGHSSLKLACNHSNMYIPKFKQWDLVFMEIAWDTVCI